MNKTINAKGLEDLLDKMYLNEEYDEINVNSCPENATREVITIIEDKLKEKWISLEDKIDDEYCETVWEFIAEWYTDICFSLRFDWENLYPYY